MERNGSIGDIERSASRERRDKKDKKSEPSKDKKEKKSGSRHSTPSEKGSPNHLSERKERRSSRARDIGGEVRLAYSLVVDIDLGAKATDRSRASAASERHVDDAYIGMFPSGD